MRTRALAALVLTLPLLFACRQKTAWPPQPVTVHLGEDTCSACRMIVSDPHFGAQLHSKNGKVEIFDDLGCLVEKHAGKALPTESIFVRSFKDGSWVRGDRAGILQAAGIQSPMGYGLAGFAEPGEANLESVNYPGAKTYSVEQILQTQLRNPHEQGRGQ
ncbi:MAG: hypothetical protein IT572_10720 [Deltaproteobacteria bacterium]|nr:hypothetical protein [Deltaproteobacteria bacterium]